MSHTPESRKRAYQKMRDRRTAWFLANGPCYHCGSSDNLELHHTNPEEKAHHAVWSWSLPKMLDELKKCIPLCYECHKIETKKYVKATFTKPIKHGTVHAFLRRKCKCTICTDGYRTVRHKRYLKRKAREKFSTVGLEPT